MSPPKIIILLKYTTCLLSATGNRSVLLFCVAFHMLLHSKTGTRDDFFPKPLVYLASVAPSFTEEAIFIHTLKKDYVVWWPSNCISKRESQYKKLYKNVGLCLSGSNFSLAECYSISLLVFYLNQNKAILQKSHFPSLTPTVLSQTKLKQRKVFSL